MSPKKGHSLKSSAIAKRSNFNAIALKRVHFCVILAELISMNLQYMICESQSLLTFAGFTGIRFVIQIV